MAVSPFKTFSGGEILTASDLNSSFSQVFDNGEDLGWPSTKAKDFDGQELILDGDGDTSITAATDDQIDFKIGGTDRLVFTSTAAAFAAGVKLGYDAEQVWEVRTSAGATLVDGDKVLYDTSGGIISAVMPASPTAGDVVWLGDYDGSHSTNNLTLGRNSSNMVGAAADFVMDVDNNVFKWGYIDATQGWRPVD